MAYKYRRNRDDFFLMGPEDEIRETQYGKGPKGHLCFPGVSSCTTLALLLADGALLGAHFAKADSLDDVTAILARLDAGRAGRAVIKLYLVGALKADGTGFVSDLDYRWPRQLATFNRTFGRAERDPILGFDQGKKADLHYRALRAGDMLLWFKKPNAGALDVGAWESLQVIAY